MTAINILIRHRGIGVYRRPCHITPLLGENNRAAKNIPVAITTILGPEGKSAWNDRYRPATVDIRPTRTLKIIIPGSRRAKRAAVAAGVTNRARTRTIPTTLNDATVVTPTNTGSRYWRKRTGIPEAADMVAS